MMKFTIQYSFFNLAVLVLVLTLFTASCTDDDMDTSTSEANLGDTWISELRTVDDGADWSYNLSTDVNDAIIAVSDQRIIKVDKDGQIVSNNEFVLESKGRIFTRIFEGKIYRFIDPNDVADFDPEVSVTLEIYDTTGALLSTHTLDTDGYLHNVQIENSETVGVMVFNRNTYHKKVQKIHIDNGMQAEYILNDSGSWPSGLCIAEDGDYYCYSSDVDQSYYHFDNDLNLKARQNYADIFITYLKPVPGKGTFVMGTKTGLLDGVAVAYASEDGALQNSAILQFDGNKIIYDYQINDDVICLNLVDRDNNLNYQLLFFDLDFNPLSTLDIPGFGTASNIIVNDNESFTFVYGFLPDPEATNFGTSIPRVFKLDKTYTIPTTIIEQ